MERLVLGGIVVLSLAILACAAPQQLSTNGRPDRVPTVSGSNGGTPGKNVTQPSAYKDNQRFASTMKPGEGELFGYPEDQSNIESKQNARNRTPVYIPERCQKNEILYPGDQESDWVCDCKPTYVYHPPTRQCYQLFTQGYCKNGTMLKLKKDAKHPECVTNVCHTEGRVMVLFDGECVALNEHHRKCFFQELKRVVTVREDTNELGCVDISVVKQSYPEVDSLAPVAQQQRVN